MPKDSAHILELAKRGAEVQARELAQELKNLVALFPHLRDSFDKDELPVSFLMAKGAGQVTRKAAERPRRRRRMSAGGRKAVSTRMKKYWQAWRKKKGAGKG
jgi:hypothetical protein